MVRDRESVPHRQAVPAQPPPVLVQASALFGKRDEIRLVHRGQEYRLRITKQGKLILTK